MLKMMKHILIGLAALFTTLTAIGLCADPPLERFEFSEPHMGTLFRIVLFAPNGGAAKKAAKEAFARIAELDGIMSDYRPASELMQLCKKAGGDPVKVSADLFAVLARAQEISKRSGGAFDVTVGPIVRLWRKARRTRQLPSTADLKRALALVGYEKIRLDTQKRTVQLLVMGMLLDLGGIAKGYAADAALEVLRRHGIRQALIAAGGDIRVGDAPPGKKGWKIGIAPLKNPDDPPEQFIWLTDAAVSTSGDSRQFVEIAGKRYSHIVDPKTGMGLVGRRSATVIAHPIADGLATTCCVLGPEKFLKFIDAMPGTAAMYVYEKDEKIISLGSKGFGKYLE
jgi:thiamine biosynthesis lipoprotein